MKIDFLIYSKMQMENKALKNRLAAFESGDEYVKLKKGNQRIRNHYERTLGALGKKYSVLQKEHDSLSSKWFQVLMDIQKENEKRSAKYEKLLADKDAYIARQEAKIVNLQSYIKKQMDETVKARKEANDEKDKNLKLQEQLKQGIKNSSRPSSQVPNRDKVPNLREKTNRKPGAQPGHEGHKRSFSQNPDEIVYLDPDPSIVNDPDWYMEDSEIVKQTHGIRVLPYCVEYRAKCFRNRKTGARYHAPFPPNVVLESNYDENVKTMIFLFRNNMNVSEQKISDFFSQITNGGIRPSRGMINGICREFSQKTEEERQNAFNKLSVADVLYTDFTNVRRNGKQENVLIVTDKDDVMYFYSKTKGDKAMIGTPLEVFMGILVHDQAVVFEHYGSLHQQCGQHVERRAVGVYETEPERTWAHDMHDLLSEMNTTRKNQENVLTEKQILDFEKRYDEMLKLAEKQYYDNPPGEYYKKGYNLFQMMCKYKDSILLFLRHPEVDFTNNISERAARKIKRHMVNSGTFRGETTYSGEVYCDSMSILESAKNKGENVYEMSKEVFARELHTEQPKRDSKGRFIKSTPPIVAPESTAL